MPVSNLDMHMSETMKHINIFIFVITKSITLYHCYKFVVLVLKNNIEDKINIS